LQLLLMLLVLFQCVLGAQVARIEGAHLLLLRHHILQIASHLVEFAS